MKNVILKRMEIKNFKGIKSFVYDFGEQNQEFIAENGFGKSTLKEAYYWALGFNDNKDINPLENNEEIPCNENSVKLYIDVYNDNESVIYELERQTKPIYQTEDDGTKVKISNATSCFVDGGKKMSLKEYNARISEILGIDSNLLYILSNNDYFNTNTTGKWTQTNRRSFLLKLVREQQMKKTTEILNKYPSLIDDIKNKKKNTEELKKDYKSELLRLNSFKDSVSNRITENEEKIKDYLNVDFKLLEEEKKNLYDQLKVISETSLKNNYNEEIKELNNQIGEINQEIIKLRNQDEDAISRLKREVETYSRKIVKNKEKIEDLQHTTHDLETLQIYLDTIKEEFWIGSTICPTCKQTIPQEQIEYAKKNFEIEKSRKINEVENKIEKYKNENLLKENEILILKNENLDLEYEKELAESSLECFEPNPKIAGLKSQKETLNYHIKEKEKAFLNQGYASQIDNINIRIEEINKQLLNKERYLFLEEENEDLRNQLKQTASKEIDLIKKRNDLKKYSLEVSKNLVDLISNLFPEEISFALFESNYGGENDEEKEVCTLLYRGIPYPSLSNGQKIKVNVDTLSTLQKLHNINLPIWCDNYESVTYEIETEQQLIKLIAQKGAVINNMIKF